MTTKIDRINSAYSRLRISGLTVQPSPDDIVLSLNRLEEMMYEFEYTRNMCMDYNFEEFPDPNSLTNVIAPFWSMIDTNLAVRLAPDFGKVVPIELMRQASGAYSSTSGAIAVRNQNELQYPRRMPLGSGNNYRFNRFQRFQHPGRLPPNECATHKMLVGEINDYQESFRAYLKSTETIDSYTIVSDVSLIIVSSANADPYIDYRIQANQLSTQGTWQQVKITITTNLGRVETRLINFEIERAVTVGSTGDDPPVPLPCDDEQQIVTVTGDYLVKKEDDIVSVTGPAIVTLHPALSAIKQVTIKSVLGGGVVMLLPDAVDTNGIDALASKTINPNASLTVFPVELGWQVS